MADSSDNSDDNVSLIELVKKYKANHTGVCDENNVSSAKRLEECNATPEPGVNDASIHLEEETSFSSFILDSEFHSEFTNIEVIIEEDDNFTLNVEDLVFSAPELNTTDFIYGDAKFFQFSKPINCW